MAAPKFKHVKCKTCNGMGMMYHPVTFLLTNCDGAGCKHGWVKVAK